MSVNLVNNTGTNYSNYYNLLNYFNGVMMEHPSIASTNNNSIEDFDQRQFPSYPAANIIITNVVMGKTISTYTLSVLIVDKYKNKNDESAPITNAQIVPFYDVDDKMDVWANTLAIMNDVTSYIQRGVTNFEINDNINMQQFHDKYDSGLCGWETTINLTTHNDKNRCLFELYPN